MRNHTFICQGWMANQAFLFDRRRFIGRVSVCGATPTNSNRHQRQNNNNDKPKKQNPFRTALSPRNNQKMTWSLITQYCLISQTAGMYFWVCTAGYLLLKLKSDILTIIMSCSEKFITLFQINQDILSLFFFLSFWCSETGLCYEALIGFQVIANPPCPSLPVMDTGVSPCLVFKVS